MSHGFDIGGEASPAEIPAAGPLVPIFRLIDWINRAALFAGMLALLGAAGILAAAVFLRYFLHQPTDWQDEVAVFLLVGTTFLCGAYVQERRGHIGIEALHGLLPDSVNRVRILLIDIGSFLFCAFFTWKSFTLLLEAVDEGQTTSSSWAPPLAIPYGLMAGGMLLLTLQLLLQVLAGVIARGQQPARGRQP
jgi:TRAP-type C4-dicarboxylate transport system permease small subunit